MRDYISEIITKLRNAGAAGKATILVPFSNFRLAVAELLQREGYAASVEKKGKKTAKQIEIGVMYREGSPRINGAKRVSKLSRRVYVRSKDIKPVKRGYGILVISTPKGVITDKEAKAANVGGEALFEIW